MLLLPILFLAGYLSLSCHHPTTGLSESNRKNASSAPFLHSQTSEELPPILLVRDLTIVTISSEAPLRPSVLLIYPGSKPRVVDPGWNTLGHVSTGGWQPDHKAVSICLDAGQVYRSVYRTTDQTFDKPQVDADSRWSRVTRAVSSRFLHASVEIQPSKGGLDFVDPLTRKSRPIIPARSFAEDITDFTVSPDGRWVTFYIDGKDVADPNSGDCFQDLWIVSINGTGLRRLGHGGHTSWSPDGRYVVTTEGPASLGRWVVRYEIASGKKQVLLAGRLECFLAAAYSPDGKTIAVLGDSDGIDQGYGGLFLLSAEGKYLRPLATLKQLDGRLEYSHLDW